MDRAVSTPGEDNAAGQQDGDGALVTLRDLTVRFGLRQGWLSRNKSDVVAVDHVNFSIHRGQTLGLVGGTGSGKSTIAHAIMGMVQPTSGSIHISDQGPREAGTEGGKAARLVQMVMQDPYSSLDPRMRVSDIIAESLTLGRFLLRGTARDRVDRRVAELLELVGLSPNKAELYPHQFSGGQRQRIAIARALAPEPVLVVLDEPTSALDVSVRAQILNLLQELQARLDVTYLIISHDLVTVAYLASTLAVMYRGRIVELGPTKMLYDSPGHPYTLELLASAPGASGSFLTQPRPDESRASLPPAACQFAPRCALRTRLGNPDRCLAEDPDLVQIQPGHSAACHFSDQAASLTPAVEPLARGQVPSERSS